MGVEVADVVVVTVLVVCMDVGMTPCTECAPMVKKQRGKCKDMYTVRRGFNDMREGNAKICTL